MRRAAYLFILLGAFAMSVEAEDKKEPPKLPKPWEEVVSVRRFIAENKEGMKLLKAVKAYAHRKEVKEEEVVFHINNGFPNGEPNFLAEGSEITDSDGVIYIVTKYQKPNSRDPHRCWVKKKPVEKKP